MLHEILLSLSGHPSPLFDGHIGTATDRSIDLPLLSPPEQALLQSIGRISRLHRDLRDHAARVATSHGSTIARAVATAVTTVHLAQFQRTILNVEEKILRRDAGSVGAYNIVPLAGVVGEFDEWTRRLEWYWQLVCFIQPLSSDLKGSPCSGAALINKLRQEAQTGYPDIEESALNLGTVAETAWLRQLSSWVLYGRLPLVGGQDFFVQRADSGDIIEANFEIISSLLPRFVTRDTASSILFIGRSLNTIRIREQTQEHKSKSATEMDLVPVHLQHLAELVFPLSSSSLSNTISSIRLSLSRNTLQRLLPLPSILRILSLLRDFFLLRRGEFAVALVNEADACVRTRTRSSKASDSLRGILIKESELTTILTKTFATLLNSTDDDIDSLLDFARSLLRLQISKPTTARPSTPGRAKEVENLPQLSPVTFNDLLLPTPTTLTMDITTPFDLFLTTSEISIYSTLQSYILSIRRAHLRLSSLWQQTSLRRHHPTPLGPPASNRPHAGKHLASKRERATRRNFEMRAVWATCSAAVFLLGEVSNYLEGEVIDEAWTHLLTWITQEPKSRPASARSRLTSSYVDVGPASQREQAKSRDLRSDLQDLSLYGSNDDGDSMIAPHDPAVLTQSHRIFLTSLCHSLLVTDIPFTTAVRGLLRYIDALVALLLRLQSIQESLDLEEDEGVVDPMGDFAKQEQEVKLELGRARKRVDSELRNVVDRLKSIDQERESVDEEEDEKYTGTFVPWRGGGIERLLMRIEGGRRRSSGEDDEDDGAD